MQNKHTPDTEGIVEIIEGYDDIVKSGRLPPTSWLKQAITELLQSQTNQYERDLELLNRIHNESRTALVREMYDTAIRRLEPKVYRDCITVLEIETIAKAHGVDLSE